MTRFPDTRGSLVAAVKSGDRDARARALETLAEAYWRPVYTYVRLKAGREHEEAADLTQEFFARLVEKDWLSRFDASKARLRTYLRVLVDGLVANESKAKGRLKRGGGMQILSLDFEEVRREVEERRGRRRAFPGGSLRKGMGAERLLDGGRALPGDAAKRTGRSFDSRSFRPTISRPTPPVDGRVTRISPAGSRRRPSTSRTSSRPRGASSAASCSTFCGS